LATLRGSLPDAPPELSDISELRALAFVIDYAARLDSWLHHARSGEEERHHAHRQLDL